MSEKVMSGWYYPVKPLNLSNFRVEGNFKIDGEYVCLGLDAAIPEIMQKKYDFVKQFNAPEPKEED
ncbi:MAG: hypothetical protein HUJ68_12020 [Clostridia bacterium]|nr:hypothetical protein [Clostridia bacterium]